MNFALYIIGLKNKLRSKCELYGIAYREIDEAYTSQLCSFCGNLDKTSRIHRGLYVCCQCGQRINADHNGARNILKKVAPTAFTGYGSSGLVKSPQRMTLVSWGRVIVGSPQL